MSCAATTKAGAQCKAAPLVGDQFCVIHSPDEGVATRRARSRSEGGKARRAQVARQGMALPHWGDLATFDEIETALRHVATEALAGRMGARDSAAATRVLRALAEAMKDSDQVEEK